MLLLFWVLKILDNAPWKPIDIEVKVDPNYCLNVEKEPDEQCTMVYK